MKKFLFFVFIVIVCFSCINPQGSLDIMREKWVIIYYGGGDNDLETDLLADVNEMEMVDIASKDIKIVALLDRNTAYSTDSEDWNGTRAYLIKLDPLAEYDPLTYQNSYFDRLIKSPRIEVPTLGIDDHGADVELDTGDPEVLQEYLHYVLRNFKADKYMLIMASHGDGVHQTYPGRSDFIINKQNSILQDIGNPNPYIIVDHQAGYHSLSPKELREAIQGAYDSLDLLGGSYSERRLNIIAFDACLMGMVEVAYELKDCADYLLASPEELPGRGYPYAEILHDLVNDNLRLTPQRIIQVIADTFVYSYTNGTSVENTETPATAEFCTLSAIDLSKMEALGKSINDLAASFNEFSYQGTSSWILSAKYGLNSSRAKHHLDLKSYLEHIPSFSAEKEEVLMRLEEAIIYYRGSNQPIANFTKNNYPENYIPPKYSELGGMAILFPNFNGSMSPAPLSESDWNAYNADNLLFLTDCPEWKLFLDRMEEKDNPYP